jgi:hypothetical protein
MDEEQLKEYQERMKARWAQNAGADGGNGGVEPSPATDAGGGSFSPLSQSRRENATCAIFFARTTPHAQKIY